MNDLISRNEAAKRLEDLAKQKEDTFAGDVLEFAAKVVRGVPSAEVPHWATEQAYKNGYEDGKPKWISANEPPKDNLPVLVTCGRGYRPFVARYDLIWKRWKVSHTLKITHWQPLPSTRALPQPPKGD